MQGRIVEKRNAILVAENPRYGVFGIPEQQVKDVRHPGGSAMVAGGVLIGVAALSLVAVALSDCTGENTEEPFSNDRDRCELGRGTLLVLGTTSGVTGFALGIHGFNVNEDSKARANGPRRLDADAGRTQGRAIGLVARF